MPKSSMSLHLMESNPEVEDVVSEATEAKEEKDPVASLTEDLQRLQAEYSNYRKRVERDRSLASESATEIGRAHV